MITVFFGAGNRSTLHDPGQAFFFGVRTVSFFPKKEMVCGKTRSCPGSFRTHFFLDGPKKKRFRAAKEKGPSKSLGQNSSPPGAGERCEKVGRSPARLRRYRTVLSGRIRTPSGRPHRAGVGGQQGTDPRLPLPPPAAPKTAWPSPGAATPFCPRSTPRNGKRRRTHSTGRR